MLYKSIPIYAVLLHVGFAIFKHFLGWSFSILNHIGVKFWHSECLVQHPPWDSPIVSIVFVLLSYFFCTFALFHPEKTLYSRYECWIKQNGLAVAPVSQYLSANSNMLFRHLCLHCLLRLHCLFRLPCFLCQPFHLSWLVLFYRKTVLPQAFGSFTNNLSAVAETQQIAAGHRWFPQLTINCLLPLPSQLQEGANRPTKLQQGGRRGWVRPAGVGGQ